MKVNWNTGLVLEGGGMRGVFTSGVLDGFMKHDVYFHYVVAVSAGACNGLSYMSHQIRRARISNIDFLLKYKYIGLRYLFSQGCIIDRKLLYEDFPEKLLPYDYDAYFNNPDEFEMVTTNCLTGRPCYLSERKDKQRLIDIVMASSSLPYVSKIVNVDGVPIFKPDKGHLHHRLLDLGFSQKQAVLLMYVISALLGLSAVVLNEVSGSMSIVIVVCVLLVVFLGAKKLGIFRLKTK